MRRVLMVIGVSLTSAVALAQDAAPAIQPSCDASQVAVAVADCAMDSALPGPFIVFFPWGSTSIDQDGREIIEDAAKAYEQDSGLAVLLSGHSDRSGPADVNLRISKQRAGTVRDALISRGVPGSAIRIEVKGEDAMLIGTSDGVREDQNRRVEIIYSRPSD